MKISHAFLLIALLFLFGCAPSRVWVNPSKNNSEAQRDFRECEYESKKSSYTPYGDGRSPISAGIQEGFQSVTLMNDCMGARGYYLTNKSDLENRRTGQQKTVDDYNTAMESHNYSQALSILDNVIMVEPNNAKAYLSRGTIYLNLNKYNEAISNYNKATKLKENSLELVLGKASYFIEVGEFDIALELINQSLPNYDLAPLYNIRSYAYNKKGDYPKALIDANKSIALDSSIPNAYKNKALAYFGLNDKQSALAEFNKAIIVNPKYAEAYFERSKLYKETDRAKYIADIDMSCEHGKKKACDIIITEKLK